jgi:lipoprotein-releasing system ATP-binding protein
LLLELKSVAKCYEASADAPVTPVLRSVDLTLDAGESLAIVGPSGSGKSTLLNIIGTLDRPSSGQVILDGKDMSVLGDNELAAVRSRDIGLVFQLHHLLPQCTVLENVLIPTLAAPRGQTNGRKREDSHARALRLLKRVGLSDRLGHRPGQLSGGERQRVAVARALINEPKLLLADEPTGALDRVAADNLADLFVEINREEGVALLVSTHAMTLAARMSRALELCDGALRPADVSR